MVNSTVSSVTVLQRNIKLLYEISAMTQTEFAERHGVTQKNLWMYLAGRAEPKIPFVVSLCMEYGIHISTMINIVLKVDSRFNITNKRAEDKRIESLRKELLDLTNTYHDNMLKLVKEMAWLAAAPK